MGREKERESLHREKRYRFYCRRDEINFIPRKKERMRDGRGGGKRKRKVTEMNDITVPAVDVSEVAW